MEFATGKVKVSDVVGQYNDAYYAKVVERFFEGQKENITASKQVAYCALLALEAVLLDQAFQKKEVKHFYSGEQAQCFVDWLIPMSLHEQGLFECPMDLVEVNMNNTGDYGRDIHKVIREAKGKGVGPTPEIAKFMSGVLNPEGKAIDPHFTDELEFHAYDRLATAVNFLQKLVEEKVEIIYFD